MEKEKEAMEKEKEFKNQMINLYEILKEFSKETIIGWMRATIRVFGLKLVSLPLKERKIQIKSTIYYVMAGYFNLINDVMYEKTEDEYLKKVIQQIDSAFNGTPGCWIHYWIAFVKQVFDHVFDNLDFGDNRMFISFANDGLFALFVNAAITKQCNDYFESQDVQNFVFSATKMKKHCLYQCPTKHEYSPKLFVASEVNIPPIGGYMMKN
jgi:hypothetical protein